MTDSWMVVLLVVALGMVIYGAVLLVGGDYPTTAIRHGCTVLTHHDWQGNITRVQRACP